MTYQKYRSLWVLLCWLCLTSYGQADVVFEYIDGNYVTQGGIIDSDVTWEAFDIR